MASEFIGHDLTCRLQPSEDLLGIYTWATTLQSVLPHAAVTPLPPLMDNVSSFMTLPEQVQNFPWSQGAHESHSWS